MTNNSIKQAFNRMWQHIVLALGDKANREEIPTVVDSLDSTSTTDALSAAQGKALKKAIDSISGDIGDLGGGDMMKATYDTDGDGIVDNSSRLEGHAASYFATAEHTHDQYLTDLPEHTHDFADLNDDADHRTVTDTEKTAWNNKVDKVEGKQLSTNDFTNEYKTKLDNINEGGGGIVTEEDPTVPAWAKEPTKPAYTAEEVGALPNTTPLFSGDYNDLENAPNIEEDDTGDFIIADNNGNILFRANNSGLETTQLTIGNLVINGMTIQELIRSVINEASL
jgi:hypothetical protein